MKRWLLRPSVTAVLIALTVFGLVTLAQRLGFLQRWELQVYDILLRLRHNPNASDPRIVIIGINEEDIRLKDYPVRDGVMAQVLSNLLKARPRVVGMDVYRDLPEPRDGSERKPLSDLFATAEDFVGIFNLPGPDLVQPPPELMESTDALGFNDAFLSDGGVVRRALLVADAGKLGTCMSLPFNLALRYLKAEAARSSVSADTDFSEEMSRLRLGRADLRRLGRNDGGYCELDTHGFQVLMDFKSPDHFATFSLTDAFNGWIPEEALRDRVVLVGAMTHSIKDFLTTPITDDQYGVVVHAQMVDQILRLTLDGEPPTRAMDEWQKRGWAFIWAFIGGFCGYALLRWPKGTPLALIAGMAVLASITWVAFTRQWWFPPVESALDFGFAALGTLSFVHSLERRQRSELMQLFSRHVSEKVAKNIWEERETFLEGSRPRSRKLTATVLFTDFVGFSSVSEKIGDPSVLMDWLNEGMEHLALEVEEHDGIINKYIGDAIMAVFGVPKPRTTEAEIASDAVNAVRCALAMGVTLEKLNAQWKEEGKTQIGMRIGVYTGSLVAGSMGSAKRLEFTVIGDTVNTASRLESTGKDEILPPPGSSCRILIGESTHALLGDRFEAEYVGEEHLKGKANTVSVYRVLREKLPSLAKSETPSVLSRNP